MTGERGEAWEKAAGTDLPMAEERRGGAEAEPGTAPDEPGAAEPTGDRGGGAGASAGTLPGEDLGKPGASPGQSSRAERRLTQD